MNNGFFVTGTDTGVGKTLVASALAAGFRSRGLRVGVMKPCETGCGEEGIPSDALVLLKASGVEQPTPSEVHRCCPYRLRQPLSPEAAAKIDGVMIDRSLLEASFTQLRQGSDRTIVEGAGGLLVPITGALDMAGLAKGFGLPLLIVARAGLGTVNHTLLTLRMARALGLSVRAVVLVRSREEEDPSEALNPDAIQTHGQVEVLGPLPFLPSYPPARPVLEMLAENYLSPLLG